MPGLTNRTPFAATEFFAVDGEARDLLVICVAGSFDLRRAGTAVDFAPPLAAEQAPPPMVEEWAGEPGLSSLRRDGQAVYTRPGTDVIVWGRALPPRGRPVKQLAVSLRLGAVQRRALVSGNRLWHRGAHGLSPTEPAPFEAMPLIFERSFGGSAAAEEPGGTVTFEGRNPLGIGFYSSERGATDRALPNIEDEAALIKGFKDRPAPFGFGAVPRHFQPRAGLGGSYDEGWCEERAPLWPDDLDERFFQGAPAGAVATPHLRGGETAILEGFSPDGPIAFTLPSYRLGARVVLRGERQSRPLRLDAVAIDTDDRRLTLFWRVAFPAHRALAQLGPSLVRLLGPTEDAS